MNIAPAKLAFSEQDLYRSFRAGLATGDFDWSLADLGRQTETPELPIVAVTRLVTERARHQPAARRRLDEYLGRLRERSGARRILSSFGEEAAPRFDAFRRHFAITGNGTPTVSDDIIYFGSAGSTDIEAAFVPSGEVGRCVVLHCMAYIHSGSSDNFHLTVLDEHRRTLESVRLGTNTMTAMADANSWDVVGRIPRLYSLAAGGGRFSLYVNGALTWQRTRADIERPAGFAFQLLAKATPGSSDGAIFEFDFWSMVEPFPGFDKQEMQRLTTLAGDKLRRRELTSLHDLLTAIEGVTVADQESDLVDAMEELTQNERGYREWLFEGMGRTLSAPGRRQWNAKFERIAPQPVIDVSNLSIRLPKNPARQLSLRRLLSRTRDDFSVLSEVNFRAFPGDVIGIIGHNGAGKSTLLRALAGLVPINSGRIFVRGRYVLLRGGLGLRSELTGRQNVISLGIHMGLPLATIAALVDDILEFADLGEHIDKPVRYYSDGMLSRLVFAIATSVSPEVLMLDELLGAGDIKFQVKAQNRLNEFIQGSKVVIVVTHSIGFVRDQCNKALLLSAGRQLYFGDPRQAIARYLIDLQLPPASVARLDHEPHL